MTITLTPGDILQARILIVDDQRVNVQLLEQVLGEAGYSQLCSTTDPQQVCQMHRASPYDLILLDLKMPLMDGFQIMQVLRQQHTEAYLPVIVLTAEPGHKQRALDAGARDFISKPFDLTEVRTRIHNMLEVRLLYQKLAQHNRLLERTVRERTALLHDSEARFRNLTKLASDWYWEQDDRGDFTTVSGPVLDIMGLRVTAFFGDQGDDDICGWNAAEQKLLQEKIARRQPFRDFAFSRSNADGSRRHFRVSGEPMFNSACRFVGFRGVGVETFWAHPLAQAAGMSNNQVLMDSAHASSAIRMTEATAGAESH